MVRKTKERAEETRQQIIDAARCVFYRYGVNGSSLDKIARTASVTRGAIYWHFKDKADIFRVLREDVLSPMVAQTEFILSSKSDSDPLVAIEEALKNFFLILESSENMREVFEIMTSRCEYVGEFSTVQSEVAKPTNELLYMLEFAYCRAAASGLLHPDLNPSAVARDTWAFASGLLYRLLASNFDGGLLSQTCDMISAHVALRRIR